MALEGKSTKKEEGRGYGLSSSRRLVEDGLEGDFVVASRRGCYNNGLFSEISNVIEGTFIYISFYDKGEDLNIYKYII